MIKRAKSRARQGFYILEMLLVISSLTAILILSAGLLAGAYKIEAAASAAFRRQANWSALADQFRADVSRSDAVPERFDNYKRDEACLILHRVDGGNVIYQWSAGQLERTLFKEGDEQERRFMPLGSEEISINFRQTQWDEHIVGFRLLERVDSGEPREVLQIVAALGGERP